MPQAGFKPTIPASDWPQTHALDQVDPGISRERGREEREVKKKREKKRKGKKTV
jgi:hypothetical protein